MPAYFTLIQKEATKDAARIAGLDILRLITEPTAAAIAYDYHKEEETKNLLVFDLGGGTFDVSVLCTSAGGLDVQAVKGDMNCGGRDFDEALLNICNKKVKEEYKVDISSNDNLQNYFRFECEKAKIVLSSELETTIRIYETAADGMTTTEM